MPLVSSDSDQAQEWDGAATAGVRPIPSRVCPGPEGHDRAGDGVLGTGRALEFAAASAVFGASEPGGGLRARYGQRVGWPSRSCADGLGIAGRCPGFAILAAGRRGYR